MSGKDVTKYPLFKGLPTDSFESFQIQMLSRLDEKHAHDVQKRAKIILECLRGSAQEMINGKWLAYRHNLVTTYDNQTPPKVLVQGAWDNEDDLWNELAFNHKGIFGLEAEAERNIRTIVQDRARVTVYNRAFNNAKLRLPPHYDDRALVYEYKRGLSEQILKALLPNTGSKTWNLEQWQNNAAELEASLVAAAVIGSDKKFSPMFGTRYRPSYEPKAPETMPAEYLGEPMDIDISRRDNRGPRGLNAGECWLCGKAGHYARDCDKSLDYTGATKGRTASKGRGHRTNTRRVHSKRSAKTGRFLKRRGMECDSDSEMEELMDKRGPKKNGRKDLSDDEQDF